MAYDAKFWMVHSNTNCAFPTREWGVLGRIKYLLFEGSKLKFTLFFNIYSEILI